MLASTAPTNSKSLEEQLRTLSNIMRRVKSGDIDTHGLRKLAGVVRENPVRTALQEQNGESVVHHDIWDEGRNFDELLNTMLDFLNGSNVST